MKIFIKSIDIYIFLFYTCLTKIRSLYIMFFLLVAGFGMLCLIYWSFKVLFNMSPLFLASLVLGVICVFLSVLDTNISMIGLALIILCGGIYCLSHTNSDDKSNHRPNNQNKKSPTDDQIRRYNRREKMIEQEYGIIDFFDKDK